VEDELELLNPTALHLEELWAARSPVSETGDFQSLGSRELTRGVGGYQFRRNRSSDHTFAKFSVILSSPKNTSK
jgi:hypothetical protein